MKKKDEIIIWSVYFDSTKTRSEGRRIPKKLTTDRPKLDEIQRVVERMGFSHGIAVDAGFPRTPWQKIGRISVSKKGSKNQILKRIGRELLDIRTQARV